MSDHNRNRDQNRNEQRNRDQNPNRGQNNGGQSNVDEELIRLMRDQDQDTSHVSARSVASGNSESEVEETVMMTEDRHDGEEFAGNENPDQTQHWDMVDTGDAEQDEEQEDHVSPTLNQMFAGSDAVRIRIAPRIMLNVCKGYTEVPDVVRIGESFYSVNSPMRKGVGKKKNPYGLIRDGLTDLARYVSSMSDRDVMFFGLAEDTEARIGDLMAYIDHSVRDIMYSAFPDPQNPMFRFLSTPEPAPEPEEEDEDGEDLDSIGVTEVSATSQPQVVEVSATESYEVVTWPVFDTDEDGTIVIRPTIAVNVKMPLLTGASSIIKPITTMQRITANYAKAANMEEDDFRLTFAFSSEDLMDPAIIELLQHFSEAEDSEAVIVSGRYLESCALSLDNDIYRLFPAGNTAAQAAALMLPEDADTLLLI